MPTGNAQLNRQIMSLMVVLLIALYHDSLVASTTAANTATTMVTHSSRTTHQSFRGANERPHQMQQQTETTVPGIYTMFVPKSEVTSNTFVRERIAEMDLLTIQCGDDNLELCRLTTLVHSEAELHHFQTHHNLDLQHDVDATLTLLQHPLQQKQLQQRELAGDGNELYLDPSDTSYETESNSDIQQRETSYYPPISGFPCYLNYEGTMQWIQDLVDEQLLQGNSSIIREGVSLSWTDIGDSYLKTQNSNTGHDIRVLRVSSTNNSNNDDDDSIEKAPLMILTGVHPREYVPPELVRQWIHWLVTTKTDLDARLVLETTDVYWIPYVNPDGRVLAEVSQLYRRKNLNPEAAGSLVCGESDFGVDLNRNFPFRYGHDDGSSSDPCLETFRGSGPASEPEIQAVIRLGESIFPKSQRMENMGAFYFKFGEPLAYNETTTRGVFLDIHSFGNHYIYPWGFENSPSPNHPELTAMAYKLSHFSGYKIQGPGSDYTYTASGASDDWAYSTLGAAAMTWEVGTTFQEDCSYFVQDILPKNLKALTYAAKLAHQPYRLSKGPDIVDLTIDSSVLREGQSVMVSVEASDSAYSNPGVVDAAGQKVISVFFFLDVNPYVSLKEDEWILAVDWLLTEDDLDENGKGNLTVEWIDVQDILVNQNQTLEDWHVIYTVAIDEDGRPGVVAAVEFMFDDRNATMSPTAIPSDTPSMLPSYQPSDTLLGTTPPDRATVVEGAGSANDESFIESDDDGLEGTTTSNPMVNGANSPGTTNSASATAHLASSCRLITLGSVVMFAGLFTEAW